MDTTKAESGNHDTRQSAASRLPRQLLIYIVIFLLGAAAAFFLLRHAWNFYNLYGGSQDRSLMAIDSANLDEDILTVTFIRSAPDRPSGAFIVSGHKPGHSNISDPDATNTVNADSVTFDDLSYEILFEATDQEAFPDRSGMVPFSIEWLDREKGKLELGPISRRVINYIESHRAFLILVKDDGAFYTSNITFD